MENLTPFERKTLKKFRETPVDIAALIDSDEGMAAVNKLYELELIDGEFSFKDGNFSDAEPCGTWKITSKGALYFKNAKSITLRNIKLKIIDNLITFILGVLSGIIVGIVIGLMIPS